jgi:hypothetical protein
VQRARRIRHPPVHERQLGAPSERPSTLRPVERLAIDLQRSVGNAARVSHSDDEVTVDFLADVPQGVRGPDLYARVTLDAASGEVLEVLAGS